ncbi:chemotaxis protein CheW [Pelobacter seleniigenes]|uniref:chemotaxis protein CheW n=1 Tax=Pelobacter seleniigenes TaxID=407188 RepID=UPI0004A7714D|nr:chemotaxis protein CheW [Pelobacter seleniigenes]
MTTIPAAAEVLSIDQDSMDGMYLTFELAGENYGLEIRHVIEIIGVQPVIWIPDMPEHVIGVLNLRGKVFPIIDVRLRFQMEPRAFDDRTCIIVVNIDGNSVGLVVDKVNEVVDIPASDIEPPPTNGNRKNLYIQGMGRMAQNVTILLNIERLINDEESQVEELETVTA